MFRVLRLLATLLVVGMAWTPIESALARLAMPPHVHDNPADDRQPHTDLELYSRVLLAHGSTVLITGGELVSRSPWLPYLLPGMWICAQGFWRGKQFLAHEVEVVEPAHFAYFKGPASSLGPGKGWVEAWYLPQPTGAMTLWRSRQVVPGSQVILVSYQIKSLPPGLQLPPQQIRGWVKAEAVVVKGRLVWQTVRPLLTSNPN